MVSVAQKTLFLKISLISAIFLANTTACFAQESAFKAENLTYKIYLNGLSLGNAVISYKPNEENQTYRLTAKAETKGFAKSLYNIKDTVIVNGYIKNNQLVPNNQSIVIKEGGYKANKTASFDYEGDLLRVQNNRNSKVWNFVLLNKARDIFSTLYSLRFNTNVKSLEKSTTIEKTIQFIDKTAKSKIMVSAPFNFSLNKHKSIKAHNVIVESERIKIKSLDEDDFSLIKSKSASAKDFIVDSLGSKKYKPKTDIRVIVSSDERKVPLLIYYSTKFGTFKAVLKK